MALTEPLLSIGAVERETGLSKDVLRKWEARYGFPEPMRDSKGERFYPNAQITRLRLIKRLLDAGLRPGGLMAQDESELVRLVRTTQVQGPIQPGPRPQAGILALLRIRDTHGLRQALGRELLKQGLARFVLDTTAPLNQAVGEAWARDELAIHAEHLYTDAVQWVLRDAIARVTLPEGRPRVLLTTLPEESHGLGVLMAASLLALEGAYCTCLGTETPLGEIVQAARFHRSEVVALSFSCAYPPRRLLPSLTALRERLDAGISLWAGGAGVARMPGDSFPARLLPRLEDALSAIAEWRSANR